MEGGFKADSGKDLPSAFANTEACTTLLDQRGLSKLKALYKKEGIRGSNGLQRA